mgnify:CR=1 FL=1
MFWRDYGSVVAWMVGAGVVLGGLLFVVIGLLTPDPGEESSIAFVLLFLFPYGAFFGTVVAVVASLFYAVGLASWTRRTDRSTASRAWVGGLSAGTGALALIVVGGFVLSGPFALPLWAAVGAACAVVALLVAAPLTARAARRADERASAASTSVGSSALPS